jgi:hypothetical protein
VGSATPPDAERSWLGRGGREPRVFEDLESAGLGLSAGYKLSLKTVADLEIQDKPLELLDGSNLLYLLSEHTGMAAKIEPPEDWVDPEGAVVA